MMSCHYRRTYCVSLLRHPVSGDRGSTQILQELLIRHGPALFPVVIRRSRESPCLPGRADAAGRRRDGDRSRARGKDVARRQRVIKASRPSSICVGRPVTPCAATQYTKPLHGEQSLAARQRVVGVMRAMGDRWWASRLEEVTRLLGRRSATMKPLPPCSARQAQNVS